LQVNTSISIRDYYKKTDTLNLSNFQTIPERLMLFKAREIAMGSGIMKELRKENLPRR